MTVISVPKPSAWQPATVVSIREETRRVKTIRFAVSSWPGHVGGQHADVRLTAEDGYRAERSYSIASPPEVSALELTVERLDDGEVTDPDVLDACKNAGGRKPKTAIVVEVREAFFHLSGLVPACRHVEPGQTPSRRRRRLRRLRPRHPRRIRVARLGPRRRLNRNAEPCTRARHQCTVRKAPAGRSSGGA